MRSQFSAETAKMFAMTNTLSSQADFMKENVAQASNFLKKLSNPDRLLVACALVDGEHSVRELEDLLNIRQPGLSQQLAELRQAGLIAARKDGKQVFYRLADPRIEIFIQTMHRLFCKKTTSAVAASDTTKTNEKS